MIYPKILSRSQCVEAIIGNVDIIYLWEKLCPASLVSQLLLELVIVLFLTVRGNTFAKKIKGDMKKKVFKKST